MAHLAAGPRVRFAVKMQARARFAEDFCPSKYILADQIIHFDMRTHFRAVTAGGSERPTCDRSYMLLELRGGGAVERPVTRIMDARCDLVDKKLLRPIFIPSTAGHEHFNRDDATIIERVRNHAGQPGRLGGYPPTEGARERVWI